MHMFPQHPGEKPDIVSERKFTNLLYEICTYQIFNLNLYCDFEILLFINKNVNIKAKKIKDD